MGTPVMDGMVWAGLLMLVVPLAIGVGVAIVVWRRRRDDGEGGRASAR